MFGVLNNNIQLSNTDVVMPNSNLTIGKSLLTGNCLYVGGPYSSFTGSMTVARDVIVQGSISNPGIISTAPYTSITGALSVGSQLTAQGGLQGASLYIFGGYASVTGNIVAGSALIAIGTITGTALQINGPFASITGNLSIGSSLFASGTIVGTALQISGPFASVTGNVMVGSLLSAASVSSNFLQVASAANVGGILTAKGGTGGLQVVNVNNPSLQVSSSSGTFAEIAVASANSAFSSSAVTGDSIIRSVGGGRLLLNTNVGSAALICSGTMVGVNTSPGVALDVNGTGRCSGSLSAMYQISSAPSTTGYSSFSALTDNNSSTILFQNGSARTADGGTLTATLRNNSGGDLRILNSSNIGITLGGSSGYVGLNTANAAYQLDCNGLVRLNNTFFGSIAGSSFVLNQSQSSKFTTSFALYQGVLGDTVVNSANGQPLEFKINGVEYMRVSSSGLIGINNTSPAFQLDCAGTGRFTGSLTVSNSSSPAMYLFSSNSSTKLNIDASSNQQSGISIQSGGVESAAVYRPMNSLDLRISTSGAGDVMTWTSVGQVGIGTLTPLYTCDVNGSLRCMSSLTVNGVANCANNLNVTQTITCSTLTTTVLNASSASVTSMQTNSINTSTLTVSSRFTSSGASLFTGSVTVANSSGPAMYLFSANTNTRLNIDAAVNQQSGISFQSASSECAVLYRPSSSLDMRMYTSSYGDLMTWTNSGMVGVRTSTPAFAVDVVGGIRASNTLVMGTNLWNQSFEGKNRLYFASNGRTYYAGGDGTHEWRVDSSGGTTGMVLLPGPFLGINISNPSYNLHCNGSAWLSTLTVNGSCSLQSVSATNVNASSSCNFGTTQCNGNMSSTAGGTVGPMFLLHSYAWNAANINVGSCFNPVAYEPGNPANGQFDCLYRNGDPLGGGNSSGESMSLNYLRYWVRGSDSSSGNDSGSNFNLAIYHTNNYSFDGSPLATWTHYNTDARRGYTMSVSPWVYCRYGDVPNFQIKVVSGGTIMRFGAVYVQFKN